MLEVAGSRPLLTRLSVGAWPARRVVIVPELYETLGEDKLREELQVSRTRNDQLIELVRQKRELVTLAGRVSGLEANVDTAGRIFYRRPAQ